jgi:hypothetical protein
MQAFLLDLYFCEYKWDFQPEVHPRRQTMSNDSSTSCSRGMQVIRYVHTSSAVVGVKDHVDLQLPLH